MAEEFRGVIHAQRDRIAALESFIKNEVLPRYAEMFDVLGLGSFTDSIVYEQAIALGLIDAPEKQA